VSTESKEIGIAVDIADILGWANIDIGKGDIDPALTSIKIRHFRHLVSSYVCLRLSDRFLALVLCVKADVFVKFCRILFYQRN